MNASYCCHSSQLPTLRAIFTQFHINNLLQMVVLLVFSTTSLHYSTECSNYPNPTEKERDPVLLSTYLNIDSSEKAFL